MLAGSVVAEGFSVSLGESQQKVFGQESSQNDEMFITVQGHVLVGIGLGINYNADQHTKEFGANTIAPIAIWTRELKKDGSLGPVKETVRGSKRNIDQKVIVEDGYIITGWGAQVKANPADVSASKIAYVEVGARKIQSDGSLSPVKVFSSGNNQKVLTSVVVDDGFVATGFGGRVNHNSLTKASLSGQKIVMVPVNTLPTIDRIEVAGNKEGDLFRMIVSASDVEDPIRVSIGAPFNADGEWQTVKGDVGVYDVLVSVTDGKATATKTIQVTVNTNKPPEIRAIDVSGNREGDLFKVVVDAFDTNSDNLMIIYNAPFNADGEWQTVRGNAGDYTSEVEITDGINTVTRTVDFSVLPAPKENLFAPVINSIVVNGVYAGDLFKIVVSASDADNDPLTISYGAPFNADGEWQSQVDSTPAEYDILVTVSDGKHTVTQIVSFTLQAKPVDPPVNSAPVFNSIVVNGVYAGDVFKIVVSASDADNDPLTISYGAPFNADGEWQSTSSDNGTYNVTVTLADGTHTTSQIVSVVVSVKPVPPVVNLPPIINSVTVSGREEGDTFKIIVNASDPENQSLTITYESPFNSNGRWETDNGDDGTYDIRVTVSDGVNTVTRDVEVVVRNVGSGSSGSSSNSNIRYYTDESVNTPTVRTAPVSINPQVFSTEGIGEFVPAEEASGMSFGLIITLILIVLVLLGIIVLFMKRLL